jgi:hypothetical protein
MEAALPGVDATDGVLSTLAWHDFADLRTNHIPLRPLVHLFYCLAMVWPLFWDEGLATKLAAKKQRKKKDSSMKKTNDGEGGGDGGGRGGGRAGGGGAGGSNDTHITDEIPAQKTDRTGDCVEGDDAAVVDLATFDDIADVAAAAASLVLGGGGGGGQNAASDAPSSSSSFSSSTAAATSMGAGRSEEDLWLAAAMAATSLVNTASSSSLPSLSSETEQHPRPDAEPEPESAESAHQLQLPSEPSSREAAAAAAAARRFILDDDKNKIDLDDATWRAQAWAIVVEPMLQSPRFPGLLSDGLRILYRPDRLAKLRASTGSADDMEDYVPLLSASAVERAHGAAGGLASWLMAREAHAQLCVERAGVRFSAIKQ